jgi:hypothetical protein
MFALPFLLTVSLVPGLRPATTVLLQFDEKYSPETVGEMKQEAAKILKDSGLRLDWRLLSETKPADSFNDVIIVRFKGECAITAPAVAVERGDVFARTHTVNGEVLPFTDVLCDKVSASVRSVITTKQRRRGNYLLGRALGRVLSHEIFHVVARTGDHSEKGVTRSALSGAQLVSKHLVMSDTDLNRLNVHDRDESEGAGGR